MFDFRPFGPRDPGEDHRAATPLELFFDLVTVIAVAAAAAGFNIGGDNEIAGDGFVSEFAAPFRIPTAGVRKHEQSARTGSVNVELFEHVVAPAFGLIDAMPVGDGAGGIEFVAQFGEVVEGEEFRREE